MIWKTLWRKHTEVYIDDAALLILGVNPDEYQKAEERERIENYRTVLAALYSAVDSESIDHEFVGGRVLFSEHCYLLSISSVPTFS